MRYKGHRYYKAYENMFLELPPTKKEMGTYMLQCMADGGFCAIDLDQWGTL